MKILVVCQSYYPEPFRVSDICEKLVIRGHEVHVLCGIPNVPKGEFYPGFAGKDKREEIHNGVHIHRVYNVARGHNAFKRALNYFSYPYFAKKAVKKLPGDFDIVFAYMLSPVMMVEPALAYGKLHHVPVVLYELDPWPSNLTAGGIKENSLIYRYIARKSRIIYQSCDRIFACSKPHIAYFEILCSRHLPISYLPQYACDEGTYHVPKGNDCRFLYVGNVGQALPLEILFDAFKDAMKENNHLYLEIAGEGSAFIEAQEYCKAHQVEHVTFHGYLDKKQLEELSSKCKAAIVLLNHQFYSQSTVPGKVQTYLKYGFPIIAADDGATKEIILESEAGLVIPTSDQQRLTEAFIHFASYSKEMLETYSKNGQAYYQEHMSEELFFRVLEEAFEELTHPNGLGE